MTEVIVPLTQVVVRPEDLDDLGWQDRALCAQTDPEAFFPEKGGSTREAKRVCRSCEVRAECLEYALENDERFGIWGGLSERDAAASSGKSSNAGAFGALCAPSRTHGSYRRAALQPPVPGFFRGQRAAPKRGMTDMSA